MALTHTACINAKPKDKAYKKYDTDGLYLLINPNGSKLWRLKYSYLSKEKLLSLGKFPMFSLAEAREERDRLKKMIKSGIDPIEEKRAVKRNAEIKANNTFKSVAMEWLEKKGQIWKPKTTAKVQNAIEKNLFPDLGNRPIEDITLPELLLTLRKMEERGAHYQAGRIKQIAGQIFRYGVASGKNARES